MDETTGVDVGALREALVGAHRNVASMNCYADPHNLRAKRDALQQINWVTDRWDGLLDELEALRPEELIEPDAA